MFRLSPDCHWPGPRSLAATNGVSVDVLSYGYLDVSVPRVPFLSLCIQDKIPFIDTWKPKESVEIRRSSIAARRTTTDQRRTTHSIFQVSKVGFPIRKSTDQSVFAAPRGLSQRITSFIGCACQGIHQMPLRHLIVLIASAHARARTWQKDQLLETCPMARLGNQSCWRPLEHGHRRSTMWSPDKSSLYDVCKTGGAPKRAANLFLQADDEPRRLRAREMVERIGIEPMTPCLQSRCSPS